MSYGYGQPNYFQRYYASAKGISSDTKAQSTAPSPPAKGATSGTSGGFNYLYALSTFQDLEASLNIVFGML